MQNTRNTYITTRRAYRAAQRVPLTVPGALDARLASIGALRACTGHWDTCEPAPMHWQQSTRRAGVYSWTVYAACTRFLRRIA